MPDFLRSGLEIGGGLVYTIHKPSRKDCVKAKAEKRYFYGRIWQKSRATVYGRV